MNYMPPKMAYRFLIEGADAPFFSYEREQAERIINNLINEGKNFTLTVTRQ